MIILQMKTAT